MKFVLNQITGKLDQVELNNISDADAATLTDDSMADTLHRHSELSASDGIPDRALVVDALGNVGIGTSTPTVPLDVSCSAPSIPVTFRNTNAAGWAGFNFFDNAGALKGSVVYENMSASVFPGTVWIANRGSAAGNDIVFATSNITERVRITKDGNVGIGTSTPTVPLDVSCSAPSIPVTFRNTNAAGWAGFNFFDNAGALKGSVVYENMSASVFPGTVWIANRGSAAGNDIVFATSNVTERVRITKDGNVGIGTPTPTAALHLKAGTATAGTAPFKFTISGAVVLTTPEVGVIEPNAADDIFYTITTGVARKGIVLNDGANLTSGKIPIASTNGRLIDGPTPLAGTKVYYVSDTSGGVTNRKLTFVDGILTAET